MKKNIVTHIKNTIPTASENVFSGYNLGQEWIDTTTGNKYYHKTDGYWVLETVSGGGTSSTTSYRFSTSISVGPPAGIVRFNNVIPLSATQIFINKINDDGNDLTNFFQNAIKINDIFYLQVEGDSSTFFRASITSLPILTSTYFTIGITPISASGTFLNNAKCIAAIVFNETLTIDSIPTNGSNNPVSSDGVFDALALKADLVAGKVPSSQLPSYVDDILEYPTLGAFPVTGEAGKVYIALDTNIQYRWSGSTYVAITNGFIATSDDITQGSVHLFTTTAEKAFWNAKQPALTYTPEDVANKSNDVTLASDSATKYTTEHAVRGYVASAVGGGGGSAETRVPVADTNYTITGTNNQLIAYTSITADRTVTLPQANTANQRIWITDESGLCSNARRIIVAPFAGDTIAGDSFAVINFPNGSGYLESNGTGKWQIISTTSIQFSSGVNTTPVITDNLNGTITIGTGVYSLFANTDGTGRPKAYQVAGSTFTLVDNSTNFIYADYNTTTGVATLQQTTVETGLNDLTQVLVYSAYRQGAVLHPRTFDRWGIALANKINRSLYRTQRVRFEEGGVLLGEDAGVNYSQQTATLTGASGNASLVVNGTTYTVPFTTTLATTAALFVTTHAAIILSATGTVVTSSGAVISFTHANAGFPTITAVAGGLTETLSGVVAANRIITISAGTVWVAASELALSALSSGSNVCYHVVQTAPGTWTTNVAVPQYNNTQYNTTTGLQTLNNNEYTVNWVYRSIGTDNDMAIVLGNASYTLGAAQTSAKPTNLPIFLRHMELIGRIIVLKNATVATQIDNVSSTLFTSAGVTDHESLLNLQGGVTGEHYHLTQTQYNNLIVNQRSAVGDTNYSVLNTDRIVATNATLTAQRTFTLPLASTMKPGQLIQIIDEFGSINGSNNILVNTTGGNTINGVSSEIIEAQYGQRIFECDGVSKYTFDSGIVRLGKSQILSNKAILPRVTTIAYSSLTSGNFAPNLDTTDIYEITNITGTLNMIAPLPAGSKAELNRKAILIILKDDGTSRLITHSSDYADTFQSTRPTSTPAGMEYRVGYRVNAGTNKLDNEIA